MGKIVAITNQKGGVGKTTTAVNLSAAIGAKGNKVLLIDMDPQGNSTQGMGINKQSVSTSIYDVIIENAPAKNAVVQTSFENVAILPTNQALIGAEIELVDMDARETRLKNAMAALRTEYDFIFIDCPPSLGLLTLNALCLSNTFLLPIQCEFYALEGLSQLMNHIRIIKRKYNEQLDVEGVLLTMYDGRLNLTQQVVDEVKKYFPRKVYKTVIPRTVRLSEAPSFGLPIMYFDRSSKGAIAYDELASEFLDNNRI